MSDRYFIDTNILMYAHDKSAGSKHERARALVEELWRDRTGVVSTQVLQELSVNLGRKAGRPLDAKATREIVADYLTWQVVVNGGESILEALDLESRYQVSFRDALILHAAQASGAEVIYSEDFSDGQKYGSVRVINPFTAKEMAVQHLPPVAVEGHRSSGAGGPDHPMRIATRRAAGLDAGGWTGDLRHQVKGFFDGLAGEWHTRTSPQRTAVVMDALVRGLDAIGHPVGIAVEVGSGIGTYSNLLAERFAAVVAIDLSLAMLKSAPAGPAHRVQADGATLPVRDSSAAAIVLINAFLFPAEVERVLSPKGALVWVNSSAEQTPIYLSVDDLVAGLPGEWTGTTSRAGEGHWCVLRRARAP